MSSTANRVVKNTGFLYAKMGITMFISLYTTRLILNSLGAADFGIFNIVGGAIAMLGFLNAAMAGATQRFMSYSEGEALRRSDGAGAACAADRRIFFLQRHSEYSSGPDFCRKGSIWLSNSQHHVYGDVRSL